MAKLDDVKLNTEELENEEDTQLENEEVKTYTQEELNKLIGKEKAKAKKSAINEFKKSDEYKALTATEKKEVDKDILERVQQLENENKSYKAKEILNNNIAQVESKGVSKRMAKMIAKDIMEEMQDGDEFSDLLEDYDLEDFVKPKEQTKTGQKLPKSKSGLSAVEKILQDKHPDLKL